MKWEEAKDWIKKANENRACGYSEPVWSFDCGMKLDFDGAAIQVDSRFFQLSKDIYDGKLSFMIGDNELFEREFSSRHIDTLRRDVELYVDKVSCNLSKLIAKNMDVFI